MNALQTIFSNKRYFAPVWVFASLNIMIGTWALYIPYVKDKLGINDAELGLALACMALGTLSILPIIPILLKRLGEGRYTIIGISLFAVSFLLPLMAPTYLTLCMALYIVGIFTGSTDIAMNALVSEVEKIDEVTFMSAAHGFFSLGGVIGAGIGSLILSYFLLPVYHVGLTALMVLLSNLYLYKHYYHIVGRSVPKEEKSKGLLQFLPLLGLGFIAYIVMGSEGAVEHWSKLYLLEVIQAPTEQLAGLGFITFSTTMTIGRFFGDALSTKWGSAKTILLACLCSLVSYGFILSGYLAMVIIGFGILGIGLSVIVPELIRLAGNTKGIDASAGISFISGVGFVGFLTGPVALGLISGWGGLKMSFMTLFVLAGLAVLVAGMGYRKAD